MSSKPSDGDPEIADASFLFDAPARGSAPNRPAPREASEETYDLAEEPAPRSSPPMPDFGPSPEQESPRPAPAPRPRPARVSVRDDEAPGSVTPVWSRWGEWGPTVLRLGVVGLVGLGLVVGAFSIGQVGLGLLLLVVLVVALALVSYPMAVTMERPVRMTPEQAARDYFAALSHHLPQYRRMWLLLSDRGRANPEFEDIAGFERYWGETLQALREPGASRWSPLDFRVAEYRGDKSAGKSVADATISVEVRARKEAPEAPPPRVFRYKLSFTRGPDRMWYLDAGGLPLEARERADAGS